MQIVFWTLERLQRNIKDEYITKFFLSSIA
jgi:hypothetical protein